MPAPARRDPGSFRDPSGYVFHCDDGVYRAVSSAHARLLRDLSAAGLPSRELPHGSVAPAQFVTDPALRQRLIDENPDFDNFLSHKKLHPLSYPYEWTISMLADAADFTLKLQASLIEHGFALKDATAYNVQFERGRPVFLDWGSFERPRRLDVWYALGQFGRMFTIPLLLARYHGWDLRSYFLASLDGRRPEVAVDSFGSWGRWRPRVLLDVTLPALLTPKSAGPPGSPAPPVPVPDKPQGSPGAQYSNLNRLSRKVRKLADGYRPRGVWANYIRTCLYSDAAGAAKQDLVRQMLRAVEPKTVLDLGCNTGDYSFLAAELGAEVIAVDADHDAVEILYRKLRDNPKPISPMVVDLGNPSPGVGFRNRERAPFLERATSDCVIALALLHHLAVAANLPLPDIRDLFFDLTRDALILEFVPPSDPMFQQLVRFRTDRRDDLTLAACLQVFGERFDIVRQEPVADTGRTLVLMRRR